MRLLGSCAKYAFGVGLKPDVPSGAEAFSMHRAVQPLLWFFLFATVMEISVAHLLLWFLASRVVAWTVLVSSVVVLALFLGFVRSLAKLPLLVDDEAVRVRAGGFIDVAIPVDDIESVGSAVPGAAEGGFRTPRAFRQGTSKPQIASVVGVHPDDPRAFERAVRARLARRDEARAAS
jgi:hypothetical protein